MLAQPACHRRFQAVRYPEGVHSFEVAAPARIFGLHPGRHRRGSTAGANSALIVRDDGPGFPEDGRHGIIDARLSRKLNGSGFALFGLAQLAEASGGRLEIGNSSSWGAEVTLTLPIATHAPISTPTPTPTGAPTGAPGDMANPLRSSSAEAS